MYLTVQTMNSHTDDTDDGQLCTPKNRLIRLCRIINIVMIEALG